MLTKLQKRKLTRFFTVWDANGDGVITTKDPEQAAQNLAKLQGLKPGSPEHDEFHNGFLSYQNDFLKTVDVDESSRVTLEEWLAYHEEMLQDEKRFEGTALMAIEVMFALMDRNRDGKITLEEYGECMKALRIKDITEKVLQKLDLNGNGILSKEEVLQLTREFFYSDDPDAPGNWALGPF
ncbi:MAG: EF-hand domain-containing protein [Anaerolineae bacterium]|nr:EF-hand domain-containing protein [Anaerolineae bacterium]